jgi:hypothetical protein
MVSIKLLLIKLISELLNCLRFKTRRAKDFILPIMFNLNSGIPAFKMGLICPKHQMDWKKHYPDTKPYNFLFPSDFD